MNKTASQIADIVLQKLAEVLPMKAKDFSEKATKFPVDVQPKYDGIRALARWEGDKVVLVSRNGKRFTIPSLQEDLQKSVPKDHSLDGELYAPGKRFQDIVSLVKRQQPDQDKLKFFAFDLLQKDNTSMPWEERNNLLVKIRETPKVQIVPTTQAQSLKDVERLKNKFERQGLEGAVLRQLGSTYRSGEKSRALQRYKSFDDDEFPITGFRSAGGSQKGALVWEAQANGKEFRVRPQMSIDESKALYRKVKHNPDAFLGKMLRVKFEGRTRDGIPRFPVGMGIRLPEDI